MTERFCVYDFRVYLPDGKLAGIVEVKGRDITWGQYRTVHVSEKKVLSCLTEAKRLSKGVNRQCPFFFVVLCRSGVFMVELDGARVAGLNRKQGGRYDRVGIKTDVETLVDIPCDWFDKV